MDDNNRIFLNTVLLSKPEWNEKAFIKHLKKEWGIDFSHALRENDTMVESIDGMLATVSYLPVPEPDESAEHCAATNYLWPKAEEVAKSHRAHILVAVAATDKDVSPVDIAILMTKLVATCLNQKYAVGVCSDVTLYKPSSYREWAKMLKHDELPLLNWIWLGIGKKEGELNGVYTDGLNKFGRDEIEVFAKAPYAKLMGFVMNVIKYELEENVSLKDGETIGFEPGQFLAIEKSPGYFTEGESLKIEYAE